MSIHSTAIIDPSAELADGVTVGAYSIVGPDVIVGEGTWIGPHVVINGPTRIGRENRIFQFASVGEIPQDKKYFGEPTLLEIGDRNVIRESATIHRGTVGGGGVTRIGSDNLLMAYIHIAHDCIIGNHNIFSNNASLAGHVIVGDWVILSGFSLVHQFCMIGDHAFSGMGTTIAKDVPPFVTITGSPAQPHGINQEGLKRRGFAPEAVRSIKEAYRVLYRSGMPLEAAKQELAEMAKSHAEVGRMAEFLARSQRSIVR